MGLFTKHTTLAIFTCYLEDEKHPAPEGTLAEHNAFTAKFVKTLMDRHYKDKLSAKWNYLFLYMVLPGDLYRKQCGSSDFRDPETNIVSRQKQFFDFCDELKNVWREKLLERYPRYNQKELASAFANAEYDWFPEYGAAVLSAIVPNLVKKGAEQFKGTAF